MKTNRLLTFVTAFIIFTLSLLVYLNIIYQLGFPDGFISELQQAQRRLAYIFIGFSLVVVVFLVYSGMALRSHLTRLLLIASLIYVLFIAVILFMNYNYSLYLLGSAGG